MKKLFTSLILSLLLLGCGHNIVIPPDRQIPISEDAYKECRDLEELLLIAGTTTDQQLASILQNVAANAYIYSECKNLQSSSIKILKKLTNKE